jgi:hypothetical protein
LEQIVSRQELQIQKLRKECTDLTEAAIAFARVVDLLRQAGLEPNAATDAAKSSVLGISKSVKAGTASASAAIANDDLDYNDGTHNDTMATTNYEYL